jgi:acyl carrier protein
MPWRWWWHFQILQQGTTQIRDHGPGGWHGWAALKCHYPCGMSTTIESRIRAVLAQHAKLQADAHSLPAQADLYAAGMSSHASVNVMLGLEGDFDIEFPDHMLTRSVFASVAAIQAAVTELTSA